MTLHFPNPSRSYDEDHDCVLFWGYDSTIEVSFSVEAAALKKMYPNMSNSESDHLKAFDAARDRIYRAAEKVYRHGGSGKGTYAYALGAGEF